MDSGLNRDVPKFAVYFARAVDDMPAFDVKAGHLGIAAELAECGIDLIDPLDGDLLGSADSSSDLVARDLRQLRECDAVLMDMSIPNRNYVGCCCELVYAYSWGKTIVVFVGDSGNDRRHWLRHHATSIVRSREEAIERIRTVRAELVAKRGSGV